MNTSRVCCVTFILAVVILSNTVFGRNRAEKVSCAVGWVAIHRACYKFDRQLMTWDDAKRACARECGYLVSISSLAEKIFLLRQLMNEARKARSPAWWVGLRWKLATRKFIWEDGGPFNSRTILWAPGEPKKGKGKDDEQCVEVRFNGFLNVKQCARRRPFICELNQRTSCKVSPIETLTTAITTSSTTATSSTTVQQTLSTPATNRTKDTNDGRNASLTTVQPTLSTQATNSAKDTTCKVDTTETPTTEMPTVTTAGIFAPYRQILAACLVYCAIVPLVAIVVGGMIAFVCYRNRRKRSSKSPTEPDGPFPAAKDYDMPDAHAH